MSRAKLVFRLERDDDGYPPVDYESVWITIIDRSSARIDNIPFFCREVSFGDLVKFELVDGELRYVSTLKYSGNSLIRVACLGYDRTALCQLIESFGCLTEGDDTHNLIAVSVPQGKLVKLQEFLAAKQAEELLGYEEAILADESRQ